MPHASTVMYRDRPESPRAFDRVPLQPRSGALDALCPQCHGDGGWNTEIDLASLRWRRANCDRNRAGWTETGSDPLAVPDTEQGPGGTARWFLRHGRKADAGDIGTARPRSPPP